MKNWSIILVFIIAIGCKPYNRIFFNSNSIEGFFLDSCELYLVVSTLDSLSFDTKLDSSSVYDNLISNQDFKKCDYIEKEIFKPTNDSSFFLKTVRPLEVKRDTAYIERMYRLAEITDSAINVLCYSREFANDGSNQKPFIKTTISISNTSEVNVKID